MNHPAAGITRCILMAVLLVAAAACAGDPPARTGSTGASPGGAGVSSGVPGGHQASGEATGADAPGGSAAGDSTTPTAPAVPDTTGSDSRGWTVGDTRVSRTVPGVSVLRSVREARQEGADRIVFDYGDDPVPGYLVSYIDEPVRQCGSGHEMAVEGEGWLQVRMEPAAAHTEQGAPTVADRHRVPRLPTIRELRMTCDFEAQVEWVAGVTAPRQYRVFLLESPNRLVVDIRH